MAELEGGSEGGGGTAEGGVGEGLGLVVKQRGRDGTGAGELAIKEESEEEDEEDGGDCGGDGEEERGERMVPGVGPTDIRLRLRRLGMARWHGWGTFAGVVVVREDQAAEEQANGIETMWNRAVCGEATPFSPRKK